jgi:hypothetical protein
VAVLTFEMASLCQVCGELKLEGEQSMHRRREVGGMCPSSDSSRMYWSRVQVLVLQQTRLHAELRWLVE